MSYIIKIGTHYIKRTSEFGAFHGSVVYTNDIADAKRFTRKIDANNRAETLIYRLDTFEQDKQKLAKLGLDNGVEIEVVAYA